MVRWTCLFLLAATCGAAVAGAADAPTKLGQKIRIPANTGFAAHVSEDGQAATILFDNVFTSVNLAFMGPATVQNQTAIQTKVVTLEIPYSTKERSVPMFLDVTGYHNVDAAARARLVICAGDTTRVVSLAPQKDVKLKGNSKEKVLQSNPNVVHGAIGDFFERIPFTATTHAEKPVLQVTVFLLTEHDTDKDGGALLAVDALILGIGGGTKAKLER